MKTLCRVLSAAALAAALGSAHAVETYDLQIYSNDFSGSPNLAGWSSTSLTTPPAEDTTRTTAYGGSAIGQFLGEFGGTQSVGFSLTDERLRNATVTLTLDFLAIRSWDGNDPQWGGWTPDSSLTEGGVAGGGSDRFTITANLATLLDASFSNGAGLQSYTVDGLPPQGDGSNDFPMAGSRAQYGLGYSFYDGINEDTYNPQDAVYGMIFTFVVGDTDTLDLTFAGLGLQETWIDNDPRCALDSAWCHYRDESWGLDNITLTLNGLIRTTPDGEVPAPGTLAALFIGLAGLSWTRRRKRS